MAPTAIRKRAIIAQGPPRVALQQSQGPRSQNGLSAGPGPGAVGDRGGAPSTVRAESPGQRAEQGPPRLATAHTLPRPACQALRPRLTLHPWERATLSPTSATGDASQPPSLASLPPFRAVRLVWEPSETPGPSVSTPRIRSPSDRKLAGSAAVMSRPIGLRIRPSVINTSASVATCGSRGKGLVMRFLCVLRHSITQFPEVTSVHDMYRQGH